MTKEELIEEVGDTEEVEEFMETFGEEYCNLYDEINELRANYDDLAIKGYLDDCGYDDLEYFEEAYQGEYGSDEEFAQQLCEDLGELSADFPPYIHIDWEWTAREIMMDYTETNGYYFRNI